MSHSTGAVKRENGEILHFEYNGTVDVCRSPLYKTQEECQANWRTGKWVACNCQPVTREKVELAVSYGGGYMWDAFICPKCMCITDRFTPHGIDDMEEYTGEYSAVDGLPDWYPNVKNYRKIYE